MANLEATDGQHAPISMNDTPHLPFAVVGIGASAGGVEAISHLLEAFPPKPGLAFLVVLHLQPDHTSSLAEILGRVTPLPVREATHGMVVQVDHVYVIPPNTIMTLVDGMLSLQTRGRHGVPMPIDHLFRSLANVQKSRAIGILLSGEGTDGTLGFQAIKAEGGVTFAQDQQTARHTAMPRSAVLDGCVDQVLPPHQIVQEVLRITRFLDAASQGSVAKPVLVETDDAINQIINLLRKNTEVDFSHYKRTTIKRRIQRRMSLRSLERVQDYLGMLEEDPAEQHHLYQDFLIRVTQCFRDPEAFEALRAQVFARLLQNRVAPTSVPIRIWVVGCSTGEEVYSLAITLLEVLGTRADTVPIKILATDVNEAALERARAGVYVDNIEIDVTSERLRRFFVRVDGNYQVSKMVRDTCIFSRHNVVNDPPFSHLDLISCRNVLIYLDAALQRRVLPTLHYALNPEGFLFLGSSETIGPFVDLFSPVDGKQRIFQKKATTNGMPLDFSPYTLPEERVRRKGHEEGTPVWTALDVQREADRLVLARYAPVGVVIDDSMTVLQFRGRTGLYLEPAPGMASLDLLRMLREGLLAEVRAAVIQAKAENTTVVKTGPRLTHGDRTQEVRIEVIPFKVPPSRVRFFLVLFLDRSEVEKVLPEARPEAAPSATDQQVQHLQQELAALREYLQSLIEEQESTNEELKSANEEILSANEELQSTNEELQTAKEEAQSANEELVTVNDELRHRNAELDRVNNDLVNLLTGVNIPIVMVDRDLRIRRFTPLAEGLINLIPTDLGRRISDLEPNLRVEDLSGLITRVIDTLTSHESEVQDRQGHWYSLHIRPYVTLDNKIDGASIVLLDIHTIKQHLEQLEEKHAPLRRDEG